MYMYNSKPFDFHFEPAFAYLSLSPVRLGDDRVAEDMRVLGVLSKVPCSLQA